MIASSEAGRRLVQVRALLEAAFADGPDGAMTDEDWQHVVGGHHVLVSDGDGVLAHAAVVARELWVGTQIFAAGYVEGVATRPDRQGEGHGRAAMARVAELIQARYQLGALATGRWSFYEHLGWERWRGETWAGPPGDRVRTPDDDDAVMVLRFGPSAATDLTLPIACDPRPGDDW